MEIFKNRNGVFIVWDSVRYSMNDKHSTNTKNIIGYFINASYVILQCMANNTLYSMCICYIDMCKARYANYMIATLAGD